MRLKQLNRPKRSDRPKRSLTFNQFNPGQPPHPARIKNRDNTPDEYIPAIAVKNSAKDAGAAASAVSEMVRTTAHGTPCS